MAPVKSALQLSLRRLAWFFVLLLTLTGVAAGGVMFSNASWAPKLGLDLEGGTQLILSAELENQNVTREDMEQAVAIIRQRIDAGGVGETEISIQGDNNIVVGIPDQNIDQETIDRIVQSAKLDFREVWVVSPSGTPGSIADIDEELLTAFDEFTCTVDTIEEAASAPSDQPLITCDVYGFKFLLSEVIVDGETLETASARNEVSPQGVVMPSWVVVMEFNEDGVDDVRQLTQDLVVNPLVPETDRNRFAIVLDGVVISSPVSRAIITDGRPQISGGFTQESATLLADQLKFGSLPIRFELNSNNNVSATLGQESLMGGLIAGIIGLGLILLYFLFQYRTLGLVVFASLGVAAVLTYVVLVILSWRQGYRLSLAGVAGIIVSIGFIADSFIVYFERIRDELRDGQILNVAVENGWKRAFRTIFVSDLINLLAAAVLYVFAVGNVQGFAFTLGLTTIIDLIVVTMFTYPLIRILARTRFFADGHPMSGLDPNALGAVYRGRARFREPVSVSAVKKSAVSKEAAKRQTIAERKAAELEASKK